MKELEVEISAEKGSPIDIPSEGIQMPDVEVGEEFPMEATFVKKDDGTICLVEVGGKRMSGYENGGMEEEKQPEGLVKMDELMKERFNSYQE